MTSSMRQMRTWIAVLISLALAGGLLLVAGSSGAWAANAYQLKSFPYCGGTHNSGSSDQAGNVYIPCGTSTNSAVYKYAPDGTGTKVTAELPFFASDVAPSPDGKYLYLAKTTPDGSAAGNTIRRLTRKADGTGYVLDDRISGGTWSLSNYQRNGVSYAPKGWKLATDGAGDIYVADGGFSGNNDQYVVVKYGSDGAYKTQFGGNARDGGPFKGMLTGVAVSSDGSKVYAMESNYAATPPQGNHLLRFNRQADGKYALGQTFGGTYGGACSFGATGATVSWIGYFAAPWDVELDGQDNVYVLNTSCYQVLKFAPNLDFITGMKVGGANTEPRHGGKPHGLAVSNNGEVYVGEASFGGYGQASAKISETSSPTVGSVVPQTGATGISALSDVTATFSEAMDASTINGSTFSLRKQGVAATVPAAVTYDATSKTAILNPSANLEANASYTATLKGGLIGVKDTASNPLAQDKTWSFTTAGVGPPDCSVKGMSGNYIEGTSRVDNIPGTSAADVICALDGDDKVTGGAGDDKMDGGAGTDTVSYEGARAGIVANLTNHDTYDPADGQDAAIGYDAPVDNFENVEGSAHDDTIYGDGGPNVLTGLGGNDTIKGGVGDDMIVGGLGADTIDGGPWDDTIKARDGEIDKIFCGDGTDILEADANDTYAVDCETVKKPPAIDSVKPSVSGMSPKPRSTTRDRTPTVKATIKDNTTNLRKSNIKLYVAGKKIIKFRYSAATDRLIYTSPRLSKGKKVVKIVARDAAGNVGARSWYFTIR